MRNMENDSCIKINPKIFDGIDLVVVRWILALTMATNDLTFLFKKIESRIPDYERVYYFALTTGHLRELAKIVGDSSQCSQIRIFIESFFDEETRAIWNAVKMELGSLESQLVPSLKKLRNGVFHYPDLKGKYWPTLVDELKELETLEIVREGQGVDATPFNIRYKFTDVLISKRQKDLLSDSTTRALGDTTAKAVFITDHIFDYLSRKNIV